MAAADVTYADVKLLKSKAKDDIRLSPEVTYSEVRRLRKLTEDFESLDSSEMRKTQARRQIKARLTAERAALLALSVLLALAIIALSVIQVTCGNTEKERSENPTCSACKNLTCLKSEAGWEPHGGNCYYFNTSKSSWTDSRRSCVALGSDLVKIDSREEQMFLETRLRGLMEEHEDKFWIGLTDSVEEGKWFWVDGSALNESLSFWSKDQAGENETAKDQDCVVMKKKRKDETKKWFARSCVDANRSICEKIANVSQCCCL